jgi:hypothetical protein
MRKCLRAGAVLTGKERVPTIRNQFALIPWILFIPFLWTSNNSVLVSCKIFFYDAECPAFFHVIYILLFLECT